MKRKGRKTSQEKDLLFSFGKGSRGVKITFFNMFGDKHRKELFSDVQNEISYTDGLSVQRSRLGTAK